MTTPESSGPITCDACHEQVDEKLTIMRKAGLGSPLIAWRRTTKGTWPTTLGNGILLNPPPRPAPSALDKVFGKDAPVTPAEDSGWKFHTVKT